MEVLVALSVIVTGVTLIAAGLSRQVLALRRLETSRIAHHLADRLLVRQILLKDQSLESELPETAGFTTSVQAAPVRIPVDSLEESLELERVSGEVSWTLRGAPYTVRLETGVSKKR